MRPTYVTTSRVDDPNVVLRHDLGGHTHYKLDYHFVRRTKFNRTILGPLLTPFLVAEIEEVCVAKRIKCLGVAIAANHVHLCVRMRPSHSPARVMSWIKSTTSKNAFERYPELKTRFGLGALWGRGYHVETLGDKNVFAILAYLGRQDEKHELKALEGYFTVIEEYLLKTVDGDDDDDDDAEE